MTENDRADNPALKVVALDAVAAAAALRAESVLWRAIQVASEAGVSWNELEDVIHRAAQVAQAAVLDDGLRVLREVRVHIETQARWGN